MLAFWKLSAVIDTLQYFMECSCICKVESDYHKGLGDYLIRYCQEQWYLVPYRIQSRTCFTSVVKSEQYNMIPNWLLWVNALYIWLLGQNVIAKGYKAKRGFCLYIFSLSFLPSVKISVLPACCLLTSDVSGIILEFLSCSIASETGFL